MEISIVVAIIIGILLLSIAVGLYIYRKKINKIIYSFSLIFIIVALVELFIFNISSYKLIIGNFDEKHFDVSDVKLNGVTYDKKSGIYKINSQDANIELLDIDQNVGTIKLDIGIVDSYGMTVNYADETCAEYFARELPNKTVITSYNRSKYIPCYLSGEVSKLKINIKELNQNQTFKINDIAINEEIPVAFEFPRYITVLCLVLFIYSSLNLKVFTNSYEEKNIVQNIILLITVVLVSILIINVSKINSEYYGNEKYSIQLVDALISGKVNIEEKVSDDLKKLENPYDIGAREGIYYLWDAAYYDGNYYVYFGVVPAILVLVPYRLITGEYLLLTTMGMIVSVIGNISLAFLIRRIFISYLKKAPYSIMLMSYIIAIIASGMLWLDSFLCIYQFIIIFAFTFAITGLYLFFKAISKEGKTNFIFLFLSCLCLALAVGCRPTYILYSVIILPKLLSIFIDNIRKKDKNQIIKFILSVAIPYVTIGICLMIYNYIRFDSILEFGQNYQLTVNDIKSLGFRISAGIIGGIQYLFSFLNISFQFPFINLANLNLKYYGYLHTERVIAGVVFLSPISIVALLRPTLKKYIDVSKNKEIYRLSKYMLCIALTLLVMNAALGGAVQRYSSDFITLLNISGIIIVTLIYLNISSENLKRIIIKMLYFCMVFTIFVNIMSAVFLGGENRVQTETPDKYYKTKYIMSFWE